MIGKSQLADKYGIHHLETWSKTIAPVKHLLRKGKKTYLPFEVDIIRKWMEEGLV